MEAGMALCSPLKGLFFSGNQLIKEVLSSQHYRFCFLRLLLLPQELKAFHILLHLNWKKSL